jgi:NTE family protein
MPERAAMKTKLKAHALWATPVVALLLTMGCASTEPPAPADLRPQTLSDVQRTAPARGQRPTVALALGGGGLRGFAHVGALRALEEAGMRPDIVVGTSAGSVVGAAYASGMSVEQIQQAALGVKVSSLLDFTWQAGGFIRGDQLANWANALIGATRIEDFPIRFAAVATDLQSAQPMLLDNGSAGRVIQASSAVPGMQVPVAYSGGHLIDGGITSLVPVRFARAMGADVVVAVDIYCQSPRATAVNVPAVLGKVMQSQSCLIAAPEMAEADVLVAPVVAVPGMSDRASQEQAIEAGYRATRAALAKWRSGAMIEQRSARFENSMTLKEVGSHENGGFVVGAVGGGSSRGPSTGRRPAGPGSEAGSHAGCGGSRHAHCSHQASGCAQV